MNTPTPTYIPAEQLKPGFYSAEYIPTEYRVPVNLIKGPLKQLVAKRIGSTGIFELLSFKNFLPLDLTASVPELRERIEELEKLLRESSKAIDELSLSPLDLAVRFGPEYGPLDANELNDLQEEIIDALAASREGGNKPEDDSPYDHEPGLY